MLLSATMGIPFPNIDPILVQVGPFAIRWYALAYIVGVLAGWWYVGKLNHRSSHARNVHIPLPKEAFENLPVWAILGILLGGRLGYVLFYNPSYFLENPSEILMVWQGGMSFHGGLIGVILAIYLMCRRYRIQYLPVMDIIACAAPIGLLLGRIANFINGELYGRITDVSWGVVFPGDPYSRHPSQLYEAGLEGLLLFLILMVLAFFTRIRQKPGMLSGMFLLLYAAFRAFVEQFREPDAHLGFIMESLTMGQLLCIPMALLGLFLISRPYFTRRARKATPA